MHAIRQHRAGGPEVLEYESLDDLTAGPGEVRVAVEVCGVHLVDTTIRRGGPDLPAHFRVPLPMTPGREIAGVVDQVGDGAPADLRGRRVVAHLGAANGGYADQAVLPAGALHLVPDGLALDVAVAAIGTGRTATAILDHAPISPDDVVWVLSASGGLGIVLLQAARAAGAVTVALANGAAKQAVLEGRADHVLDHTRPDALAGAPAPTLVLEGAGGALGRLAFEALRPGGRLLHYGGEPEGFYAAPDRTAHHLLGPGLLSRPGGMRSLETESLARAAEGSRVPLVGSTFALRDAAGAHRALEERRTHGKVVLRP